MHRRIWPLLLNALTLVEAPVCFIICEGDCCDEAWSCSLLRFLTASMTAWVLGSAVFLSIPIIDVFLVFCRTSCLYKPRCHYVACREKDTDPGTDTSDAGDPQQNLHWHLPPANTHSFSSESGNKFLKYAYICRYIYQLYKFRVSAPLLKLSAHRTASFTRGDHPRAGVACLSRRNTFYLFFSQRYYGREKILRPPNLSNPEEVRCIFIILNGNDTAQDTTSDRDAYVIGDRFLAL